MDLSIGIRIGFNRPVSLRDSGSLEKLGPEAIKRKPFCLCSVISLTWKPLFPLSVYNLSRLSRRRPLFFSALTKSSTHTSDLLKKMPFREIPISESSAEGENVSSDR